MGQRNSHQNPKIGQTHICPSCNRAFPPSTTQNTLHAHIDHCLLNNNGFQMPAPPQQNLGDDYIWTKHNGFWVRIKSNVNGAVIQVNICVKQNYTAEQIKNSGFAEKQLWFKMQLEKRRIPWQLGSDKIMVNLNNLLYSSLEGAQHVNMYKEVKVVFENDKVQDAGGLLREWLTIVFKDLCKEVFTLAETEDALYRIFTNSVYFELVGLALGKALFERMTISVEFDRPLIKRLLGQEVVLEDIERYDKALYKSWDYMLKNHFDPEELQQYFVVCKDDQIIELKQNGADILVNNENKHEYVSACIQYYTHDSIRTQLTQIQTALYKYIPKEYLSIFTPSEFEMLLYGVPIVDLGEWKSQTVYQIPYTLTSPQITNFWKILGEFDQDQLKKFLHFCTGSYRVPVNGFSKLESNRGQYAKFQIKPIDFRNENSYPIAHTCFNRLELPKYPNEEIMRKYLKSIVMNDLEGVFGME